MGFLLWKLSSDEEIEATIKKIADRIVKYGMETPAIMVLETIKPLSVIGGPMSRVFISPWASYVRLEHPSLHKHVGRTQKY